MQLSALGFPVKEMIGGMECWAERERYPLSAVDRYNRYGLDLHKFLLDNCTFVHYIIAPEVARQWLSCPLTP